MVDQTGLGTVKKFDLGKPGSFFYSPTWSPDSKKIAFTDKRLNLWYVDVEKPSAAPVKVDTDLYDAWGVSMTPDVVAGQQVADVFRNFYRDHLRAVFVYSLDSGKSSQITDGLSDARYPVFDKGGKVSVFRGEHRSWAGGAWLDLSGFQRPVSRNVYGVVLKEGDANPIEPRERRRERPTRRRATTNKDVRQERREGQG